MIQLTGGGGGHICGDPVCKYKQIQLGLDNFVHTSFLFPFLLYFKDGSQMWGNKILKSISIYFSKIYNLRPKFVSLKQILTGWDVWYLYSKLGLYYIGSKQLIVTKIMSKIFFISVAPSIKLFKDNHLGDCVFKVHILCVCSIVVHIWTVIS